MTYGEYEYVVRQVGLKIWHDEKNGKGDLGEGNLALLIECEQWTHCNIYQMGFETWKNLHKWDERQSEVDTNEEKSLKIFDRYILVLTLCILSWLFSHYWNSIPLLILTCTHSHRHGVLCHLLARVVSIELVALYLILRILFL